MSVSHALDRLAIPHKITDTAADLTPEVRGVVLPGVGAFDAYIEALHQSGFYHALPERVAAGNCQVLGICSGAQVLFDGSDEGTQAGLGILPGRVTQINTHDKVSLPHIGWNHIHPTATNAVKLPNLNETQVYFCHSYRFPNSNHVVAVTEYGERFPAIVATDSVSAIQFHPEKSHTQGLTLLKHLLVRNYAKAPCHPSVAAV